MKTKLLTALLIAAGTLSAQFAHAAPDGTITFTGSITDSTCTINGGTSDIAVGLPPIPQANLSAATQTAGSTRFTINLTNCTGSATKVHTSFGSGATVTAEGRLKNMATTAAASDVEIQLQNVSDSSVINIGASDGMNAGEQHSIPVDIVGNAASMSYNALYYAATNNVTAGAVTSSVTYSISYE